MGRRAARPDISCHAAGWPASTEADATLGARAWRGTAEGTVASQYSRVAGVAGGQEPCASQASIEQRRDAGLVRSLLGRHAARAPPSQGFTAAFDIPCCASSSMFKKRAKQENSGSVAHGLGCSRPSPRTVEGNLSTPGRWWHIGRAASLRGVRTDFLGTAEPHRGEAWGYAHARGGDFPTPDQQAISSS